MLGVGRPVFTAVLTDDSLIGLPKLPAAPSRRLRLEVSRLTEGEARTPMSRPVVGAAHEVPGADAGTSTDRAKPDRLALSGGKAFVKAVSDADTPPLPAEAVI